MLAMAGLRLLQARGRVDFQSIEHGLWSGMWQEFERHSRGGDPVVMWNVSWTIENGNDVCSLHRLRTLNNFEQFCSSESVMGQSLDQSSKRSRSWQCEAQLSHVECDSPIEDCSQRISI